MKRVREQEIWHEHIHIPIIENTNLSTTSYIVPAALRPFLAKGRFMDHTSTCDTALDQALVQNVDVVCLGRNMIILMTIRRG